LLEDALTVSTDRTYTVKTAADLQGDNFLYVPQTSIGAIADFVIHAGYPQTQSLEVNVSRSGNQIAFAVQLSPEMKSQEKSAFLARIVSMQNEELRKLPIRLELGIDSLQVVVPYEPTLEGAAGQPYSIAY
jgi:hypothetical protein